MSAMNPSVPAVVSTGLICLALGVGAGVVTTQLYGPFMAGEKKSPNSPEDMLAKGEMPLPGPPVAAGMGGEGKGKGKGKGKGGMGGAGRGPSARAQLVRLVSKLDQLTGEGLTIRLTDEQKAKLAEQLAGLDKLEELKDDEADKRLKAILEVIENTRATLEAAGYTWPGAAPMARPQPDAANPFSDAENSKPLKALQERVGKGKS
jgi:hypothetical protein